MYDKSKKTWSQRLKIQKNEKNQLLPGNDTTPPVTATSSLTVTPTTPPSLSIFSAPGSGYQREVPSCTVPVTHNVCIANEIPVQYQISPAAIMHLPLNDYPAVGSGGGVGATGMGPHYDYMTGRAMKYGESWIYGTVRGIPARPAAAAMYHPSYAYVGHHPHAAAIFAPTERPTATAAMAVVLCSCPEYLSGTKGRSLKKPCICKKCKGTRLPLANLGGTVRVHSSIPPGPKLRPVGPSATVRVVSTTKRQRPTILDPQKDPYDLMRRTRLLSPEPGASSIKSSINGQGGKDKSRNRGVSPTRGRSRTRPQLQKASVSGSTEATKAVENLDESWLMEAEDLASQQSPTTSSHSRKSILRCNVNPYDLISINAQIARCNGGEQSPHTSSATSSPSASTSQEVTKKSIRKQQNLHFSQNEFMPPNDDFNIQDAALVEDDSPPFLRPEKQSNKNNNTKNDETSRKLTEPLRGSGSSNSTNPNNMSQKSKNKKPNYSNVQAIAGQRISLGEELQTPKSLQHQKLAIGNQKPSTYEGIEMKNPSTQNSKEFESPKVSRPDSLQFAHVPSTSEPTRPPRINKQQSKQGEVKDQQTPEISEDDERAVTVTVTPNPSIKSILKRPSSKTSENGDNNQSDSHSKILTPSTSKEPIDGDPEVATSFYQSPNSTSASATSIANSQFYISLPQARKKVQFMVEEYEETETDGDVNNDNSDSDGDDSGQSNNGELVITAANYDYYNRKRNQERLLHTMGQENESSLSGDLSTDSGNQVITYDEQFIQAMLLEKLQLDSELVTRQQELNGGNKTTLHITEETKQEEEEKDIEDYDNPDDKEDGYDEVVEYGNRDYEDIFAGNVSKASTTHPTPRSNAAETIAIASASINQQEMLINSQTPILPPMTTKLPFEVESMHQPQHSLHQAMANVTDKREEQDVDNDDDDSNGDGDFPVKGKNAIALIDEGRDKDDDGDGLPSADYESRANKDNSSPHDHTGGVDDDDDGYEAKVNTTSSSSSKDMAAINVATLASITNIADDDSIHHDIASDDDDGNSNKARASSMLLNAQCYGATKPTISTPTAVAVKTANTSVTHDDRGHSDSDKVTETTAGGNAGVNQRVEVKTKQEKPKQQHKLSHELLQSSNAKAQKKNMQTIHSTASGDRRRSLAINCNNDADSIDIGEGVKPTKEETQSHKAIRRSQSERQPTSSAMAHLGNKNDRSNRANSSKSDVDSKKKNNNINKQSTNSKPDISNGVKDKNDGGKEKFTKAIAPGIGVSSKNGSGKSKGSELNFQDTMALRKRCQRSDTRDLFTMGPLERPREPPPPPPVTMATTEASSLPKAAHLEKQSASEGRDMASMADVLAIECLPQIVSYCESKQENYTSTTSTDEPAAATTSEVISQEINDSTGNDGNLNEQMQQQKMTKATSNINTTPSVPSSPETNGSKSSMFPQSKAAYGSTLATYSNGEQKQRQPQRTVVRVAPFNKQPSNSFDVHRLKITHTDHNNDNVVQTPTSPKSTPSTPGSSYSPSATSSHYSVTDLSTLNSMLDYGQKKTSILITGDDCYSTMNLSCDDSSTPLYQSSVVVTDSNHQYHNKEVEGVHMTNAFNTVTINVSSPRNSEDELILQHNQLNNILKRQSKYTSASAMGSIRAIIPIRGTIDINLQRSASSTSSTSTSSMTSTSSSTSSSTGCTSKRGKTLIRLDYEHEKTSNNVESSKSPVEDKPDKSSEDSPDWLPHESELLKILRNPVEAVKRNLVPHICKLREDDTQKDSKRSKKMKEGLKDVPLDFKDSANRSPPVGNNKAFDANSFIGKLLEDPMLNQVAEGLESDTVCDLIENSLKRLQESRNSLDMSGTKDNDDMNRLIDLSLKRLQEERKNPQKMGTPNSPSSSGANGSNLLTIPATSNSSTSTTKDEERLSNRGSISSANSFASAHNYELFDFEANESDCYQSCSSDINSMLDDEVGSPETKSKFYQMLVDATLQEIELSTNAEDLINADDHQYESIRHTIDPIYEEITDMPPPLPLSAPPLNPDPELEKKSARSIFEGASKYDILSYLVEAKERGLVKEEVFDYPLNCSNPIIIEEESSDTLSDLGKLSKLKRLDTISSRSSIVSDSSEDTQSNMSSLSPPSSNTNNFVLLRHKQSSNSDIERNDSGVGSETSKTSRSRYLHPSHNSSITSSFSSTTSSSHSPQPRNSPLHLCEDCDGAVETQIAEDGSMFAPLVCRKCSKKRVERKEILTEIVETEEKYGRDLQIILEEFCHPMLVAGLLTQEQLSAIFLNTEELLENNQTLAERMRDALDIALEQGDDDLLTVNIGKIFLEFTQMLHAFESYCVRQAGASLLLANLEKDKELLRIFLKVSQMENAVLRRMNLNSFLMVPVQRVTKYPLLLARLYKVTPAHLEGRDQLKQAQEKIELHLNHINQEAKDVPTKLWRRISSSSPNRRASCEIDMINIKLRKMAIDVLEWNHDEVRFVMEGKLLYTQPTDGNWKKARTIKLTSVNALLVTNGKPSTNYKAEKVMSDKLNFNKHTGIREASLLLVKEKCGRYALIREPLYLDRCVVCSEADWDEYFEIQEISSKDTFIFKAEDNVRTKQWYTQLQYHAQGMGAWRKRRNALANIMINGMLTRS
ncbi:rho guanine nucleotide exchange factor at 64C [Haematobia irritans]|uniref:rho guanine nucleotide exchange factor at 64C n=1 Tax=Haematobia irritans TaxID=7368 RepID=UPI003F4F7EF4